MWNSLSLERLHEAAESKVESRASTIPFGGIYSGHTRGIRMIRLFLFPGTLGWDHWEYQTPS